LPEEIHVRFVGGEAAARRRRGDMPDRDGGLRVGGLAPAVAGLALGHEDAIGLCHLGVPRIQPADWSLTIDGLVEQPRVLRLDDLTRYPKVEVTSFHQCAGSPLAPFEPTRRVSNIRWGGVRLAELLAGAMLMFLSERPGGENGAEHGYRRGTDNYRRHAAPPLP